MQIHMNFYYFKKILNFAKTTLRLHMHVAAENWKVYSTNFYIDDLWHTAHFWFSSKLIPNIKYTKKHN